MDAHTAGNSLPIHMDRIIMNLVHIIILQLLLSGRCTIPPQVPDPARQHDVMIEAVENHMPQVGGPLLLLPVVLIRV